MLRVSIESAELESSESLALGSGIAPPRLRKWKNRYNRLKTSPIVILSPLAKNFVSRSLVAPQVATGSTSTVASTSAPSFSLVGVSYFQTSVLWQV